MDLKDMLKQELIGCRIKVVDARNAANTQLTGVVVDETRNMLTIAEHGVEKKLIKKDVTIQVTLKGETYNIDGKLLVGKPEDRLKKRMKL